MVHVENDGQVGHDANVDVASEVHMDHVEYFQIYY